METNFELQQILPIDNLYFNVQYTDGENLINFIIKRGDDQKVKTFGTAKELEEYYKR